MRDAKLNGDCCIEVLELLGADIDRQRPKAAFGRLRPVTITLILKPLKIEVTT
jgi:hypothetical protein